MNQGMFESILAELRRLNEAIAELTKLLRQQQSNTTTAKRGSSKTGKSKKEKGE